MIDLGDKVAIVTGAARGIGFACAQRFNKEGARVVVADLDEEHGNEAVKVLRDNGGEATFVSCDVGDRLDVHNLVASTIEAYGRIDVLVNNAAVVHQGEFLDLSEADFERVMRVNLKGAFLTGQAVAKEMKRQFEADKREGAIINMSSVNSEFAIPDQAPYVISKGGINQLTRVMAVALAKHGIRVNAIGPGSVTTEMLKELYNDPGARDRILSRTPLGRIGSPDDVASVAAFLASDEAAYVTGEIIYVDGGRRALNFTVQTG